MKVYLKEIQENDTEYEGSQDDAWVRDSIAALDESTEVIMGSTESLRPASLKTEPAVRPTNVRFNMRRVDEVIMVSGDMETSVQLICSRCAAPFLLPINEHFTAMYCKDKEMAGIAYLDKNSNPRGQNKGHARHAHDFNANQGTEANEDLEINYIAEEFLDLAVVLTEQVTVRIPFQPLHSEECKGVCANCGADLNVGRCACSKLQKANPFEVLKNIKLN